MNKEWQEMTNEYLKVRPHLRLLLFCSLSGTNNSHRRHKEQNQSLVSPRKDIKARVWYRANHCLREGNYRVRTMIEVVAIRPS